MILYVAMAEALKLGLALKPKVLEMLLTDVRDGGLLIKALEFWFWGATLTMQLIGSLVVAIFYLKIYNLEYSPKPLLQGYIQHMRHRIDTNKKEAQGGRWG